jgi:hypothetical protein
VAKQVYLKNKEFLAEIILSKEQGELTENAKQMLMLLGNKCIKKMRYYNPIDREDCLQTGLMVMFSNWHNFDPAKSNNAFAYFTEIFKRGIAKGFNELYKKKGDPNGDVKQVSIQSSNDGEGIYNI